MLTFNFFMYKLIIKGFITKMIIIQLLLIIMFIVVKNFKII